MNRTFFTLLVLSLSIAIAHAEPNSAGKVVTVRTYQVDGRIVATGTDGSFYAIVCHYALIGNSHADILFPNRDGELITKNYDSLPYRHSANAPAISPFRPLDEAAVKVICKSPNGIYSLRFPGDETANAVELVAESTQSAR